MDRSLRAGAAVLRRTRARVDVRVDPRVGPEPPRGTPRGVHGSAARGVLPRFTPVLETPEMDAEYEKLPRRSAVPQEAAAILLLEALVRGSSPHSR